jgi:hypothetical protein
VPEGNTEPQPAQHSTAQRSTAHIMMSWLGGGAKGVTAIPFEVVQEGNTETQLHSMAQHSMVQ